MYTYVCMYAHTRIHPPTNPPTHTFQIPVKKVGSSTRSMSAAADNSRVPMRCSCIT